MISNMDVGLSVGHHVDVYRLTMAALLPNKQASPSGTGKSASVRVTVVILGLSVSSIHSR